MEIQRQSPHLPTELWVRVLECLNDDDELPLLWACCRHVSTAWREAVEFMFRQIHLRETWITIDLRTHSDKNIRLEDRSVSVIFTYSHLSHDKKTAYFSFINESSYIEDYEGRSRRAVRYAAAFKNIEEPAHHVQVRGDLNDTPVPKLKIDCDAMLLSFDWRGVYSAFYGEEKLYRDINNQLFEELKDSLGDLQTKMDGGQLALDCATATLRTIQERIEKESRHAKILARRSRIRRQFKELNGTEWDAERDWDLKAEEIVMKELAFKAEMACWWAFSDDADDDDAFDEDDDDEDQEDGEELLWDDDEDEETD